jgi:hypothetical protein
LMRNRPMAGMDMMTVLARQFHASQKLVQTWRTRWRAFAAPGRSSCCLAWCSSAIHG